MFTGLFSQLCPFTSALSFNFTSFDPQYPCGDPSLMCQRAFTEHQVIQLTGNQENSVFLVGRATYSSPMHLWDKAYGKLTDFTTNFSFVIHPHNRSYGDGLAFFLAPKGSTIPNVTQGGAIGLTNDNEPLNSTDNPFVAVEFDIFSNIDSITKIWDSLDKYVGIDINSMESVANVQWLGANISIMEGRTNEAQISYNSSSHNLSVLFTSLKNDAPVWQSLSYNIDLRDHLPEWVTLDSQSQQEEILQCIPFTHGILVQLWKI
jgi:hypothetical protein